MALVCQCPTCGLFVMSPSGASDEDQVRCPHCVTTFTLGDAHKVSLPRLIRVQKERQDSEENSHDTSEGVPWEAWSGLVSDETSLDNEPSSEVEPEIASPEVHVIEPEITAPEVHVVETESSDEGSFLTTVTPASEASTTEDDEEDVFDFVIEGDEASKIFGKQDPQSDAEEAADQGETDVEKEDEEEPVFDLTFDETILEAEEDTSEDLQEVSDDIIQIEEASIAEEEEATDESSGIFDFEAEPAEFEPSEFLFEPDDDLEEQDENLVADVASEAIEDSIDITEESDAHVSQAIEAPLVATQEQRPLPSKPVGNPMAVIGRNRKHKNRAFQFFITGIFALLLLGGAYYSLCYFGGPESNFLGIPLPGCPQTSENGVATTPLSEQNEATGLSQDEDFADSFDRSLDSGDTSSLSDPVNAYHSTSGASTNDVSTNSTTENNEQVKTTSLYIDPDLFIPSLNVDKPRPEFQLAEGKVGLEQYPLFDVRELEATLNATHEEFGCPQCKSTGYLISPTGEKIECDFCNGEPANMMTTMGYRYFCQLAQVATLLGDNSPRAAQAQQDIKELLKKVATTQTDYNELCKLTQVKADETLHPYEGIMAAGLVRIVKPENGLYGAVIGPPDSQRRVTVISDRPFNFEAGDRVVLLGSVIPDPSEKIVGYSSTKPWVIWYGDSVTLPDPLQ